MFFSIIFLFRIFKAPSEKAFSFFWKRRSWVLLLCSKGYLKKEKQNICRTPPLLLCICLYEHVCKPRAVLDLLTASSSTDGDQQKRPSQLVCTITGSNSVPCEPVEEMRGRLRHHPPSRDWEVMALDKEHDKAGDAQKGLCNKQVRSWPQLQQLVQLQGAVSHPRTRRDRQGTPSSFLYLLVSREHHAKVMKQFGCWRSSRSEERPDWARPGVWLV